MPLPGRDYFSALAVSANYSLAAGNQSMRAGGRNSWSEFDSFQARKAFSNSMAHFGYGDEINTGVRVGKHTSQLYII
jgi:hypothetical protein